MRIKLQNRRQGVRHNDRGLEHRALLEIQAELETSRARYAELYDSAPVGYAILSRTGIIQEINLAGARLLNCTREELIRRPLRVHIAMSDRKKFLQHLFQARRSRASVELELKRRNGEPPVFVELITTPPAIYEGLSARHQCALVDITERKRTEHALLETKKSFERFMQHLPGLAWIKDADGRYVFANEPALKNFSITPEKLYGRTDAEVFPQEIAIQMRENDQLALAGCVGFQTVEVLPHGDGEVHHSLVHKFSIPAANKRYSLIGGMAIDITERKRMEEALRESEDRFRTMANAAPVMIWMSGTDKLFNYFNQRWLEFTGRKLEQELGNGWLKAVHPADLSRSMDVYVHAFDRREPFEMEYRLRRADGEYRWILEHGVPRFTPAGCFVGYIGSCKDITARRDAEAVLKRSHDELENRVRERTAELAQSNKELENQIQERRQLEALVLKISEREQQRIGQDLHDGLCQQLTGIKFRNQLLQQKLSKRAVPEIRDVRTIEALLNQAIEQARTQSRGLNPVRLEKDGLATALRELAGHVSDVFNIRCHCEFQKPVPIENRDVAIHLYRIAQEAVTNAIKHGRAKKVTLQFARHGKHIRLAVQDNGIGFPRKPKKKPGMGMHIMNYRAHTIGATLEVQHGQQRGATVICQLPVPVKSLRKG